MLSKCVSSVVRTAIRYNLCTINAFRPLRIAEFKQIKNVYQFSRQFHSQNSRSKTETKIKTDNSATSVAYYSMALVVLCGGLSFAAVPLYRLFCQVTCSIIYHFFSSFSGYLLSMLICSNRHSIRTFRPQAMAEQSTTHMMLVKWRI